jgi:hypothetical protein
VAPEVAVAPAPARVHAAAPEAAAPPAPAPAAEPVASAAPDAVELAATARASAALDEGHAFGARLRRRFQEGALNYEFEDAEFAFRSMLDRDGDGRATSADFAHAAEMLGVDAGAEGDAVALWLLHAAFGAPAPTEDPAGAAAAAVTLAQFAQWADLPAPATG